ncbi:MAG TPA: M24 family metallopeptidase [Alphaproteobacteria bacterium]|nr:M24 family metallopeptidase [Alphaproteobacteria bacterium]
MSTATTTRETAARPGTLPRPSLAERDRRHRAIRAAMAEQSIDVLLLSPNTARWAQMMADSRYVTAIGGFATEVLTIFPREGEVTAYVYNRASWWKKEIDWITDVRDGRNEWGANAVERIRELGLERGRIGISGLADLARAPSGTVTFATVDAIARAFSAATIVNATPLMQNIRAIKSAEEVAFLERSMAIVEKMIAALAHNAKPGAVEKELYGLMTATLLANDGELPNFLLFATGPGISRSSFVPTNRVLGPGDRIVNEIEAKYAGYGAQAVAPIVLGKPDRAYADLIAVSRACFDLVLGMMKPGVTFGALMDAYTSFVAREGKGELSSGLPMMHARGLGDDGPALLRKADLETFRNHPLREGMTFILKPRVAQTNGRERGSVGDTVAVTATGARRLGKRELKLITVE